MPLHLIEGPDEDPIDLEQAKTQCSLTGIAEFDPFLLDQAIPAAHERGVNATRRQWITALWEWQLNGFPCARVLELPRPPLLEVLSVKYTDTAGVTRTFDASNYVVQAFAGPKARRGRIGLKDGISWPTDVAWQIGAVQIQFRCGYGGAADVPALLRQAALMDLATLFAQRENVVTGTIVAAIPGNAADIYRSFKSYGSQSLPEDL